MTSLFPPIERRHGLTRQRLQSPGSLVSIPGDIVGDNR